MGRAPEAWRSLLPYCETDRQKEVVEAVARCGSINRAAGALGLARSTTQEAIKRVKQLAETSPVASAETSETGSKLRQSVKELRKSKRYVVTSAQNNTKLHEPFLQTLIQFCDDMGAQLLVIPVRYKNPDAFHQDSEEGMQWPSEVLPFLLDRDIALSKSLAIMGDAKINATAASPLSGMETLSGARSGVFGHAQVQMRMVPTSHSKLPKMVHTTGSVSRPNYSRSKAGKRGAFNHTFGAVYLETWGDEAFFFRQLTAGDDGVVYDLDRRYDGRTIETGIRAEGLVIGDEHIKWMPDHIKAGIFDDLVPRTRPKMLVRHDVHDHYSQSHHHSSDTILRVHKAHNDHWSVADELRLSVDHVENTTPEWATSCIVDANHIRHLRQWLNGFSANADPHNALIAWELQGLVAESIKQGKDPDPFELYMRKHLSPEVAKRVRFVSPDEELLIGGIDCSQHGDRGPNGARPSLKGFARAMRKMFVGHSHTPGIEMGAWSVGVSAPDMAYAKGLSSWMVTHGLIHPNGKRQLISMIDGMYERPDSQRRVARMTNQEGAA